MNQELLNQLDLSRFDYESGLLCLDFANTANWHAAAQPEEALNTYADLAAWGAGAGLYSPAEAARLIELAEQDPRQAERWLARAIDLREAIYRIFVAQSENAPPAQPDLDPLTAAWQEGARFRRLLPAPAGLEWVWHFDPHDLGRMLWPAAFSAVETLQSDQRKRVGLCADDRGCGYLFIDTSRNHSRRWCSMEGCGNRAKAQRHYTKKKAS